MPWFCLTREFPLPDGFETNQHQTFYAAAVQAPDGTLQTGIFKFSLPEPNVIAPFPNGLLGLSVFQVQGFEQMGKTNFLYTSLVSSPEEALSLKQYADEIRQPIAGSHPIFGDFRHNKEHENCYATYAYLGQDVTVVFSTDRGLTYESMELALDTLGGNFPALIERAKAFAFDELSHVLQQWNETKHISKDMFVNAISPCSVSLYVSGEAELTFSDGDLFVGHAIMVSVSADGTFADAGI